MPKTKKILITTRSSEIFIVRTRNAFENSDNGFEKAEDDYEKLKAPILEKKVNLENADKETQK